MSPWVWGWLVFCTLVGAIAINLLHFTGIGRVGPSRTAMNQYVQTFMAVIAAVLLLGESISVTQLAGGAIIVVAVAASRARGPNRANPTTTPIASADGGPFS